MRKITIALLSGLLYTGCSMTKETPAPICLEYKTYETTEQECVGGRGVAPQICFEKVVVKTYCSRYAL